MEAASMEAGAEPCRVVLIAMGVSGSGKSTIAQAMADQLHWPFQEGDALHPPSNIQKMHAGVPLTDADRAPWLAAVKVWIDARVSAGEPGIVTCSALRRAYRTQLVAGRQDVRLLYLQVDREVLEARLEHRTGHFMPGSLLQSQLETLEEPSPAERPMTISVQGGIAATIAAAMAALPRCNG